MPLTNVTIGTHVFLMGNFGGFNVAKNAGHSLFNYANVRVNLNYAVVGNATMINPQINGGGDTIYLSYFQNEISSVKLPNPPPAGVDKFLTDGLSGCKIFVDRINGSNDILVYHANARQHSPPGNLSGTQPNLELAPATAMLNNLHVVARGHWQGAPHNLALGATTTLDKPAYNHLARAAVDRKVGQNRQNVEFIGGTIVAGFFVGGTWRIHYQTFGDTEYDRPWHSAKRIWQRAPVHYQGMNPRVISSARFF